ncbi:MAG: arginine decarboxylase, partial [Lachnospiraceae bacterium]|nr:arginine decarboxylase [Lachnospiraceae bacterium]
AAVSMHKTGGSLTQSSFLLCNKGVDTGYVRQIINLTQTTSGSYLLLSSLDISRKNLYLNGKYIFERTVEFTRYAREEINAIGGYYAFGDELVNKDTVFAFDPTKLSVNTRNIGLAGIEVYDLLRDEYDIQIEFGDIGNILAIVSGGERELEIERLLSALSEIKRIHGREKAQTLNQEYIDPSIKLTPHEAFFAPKKRLPIEESAGYVSAEFVMCYPPGIPILAPGELVTKEITDYVKYAKEKGCQVTGTEDMDTEYLNVVK